MNEILVVLVAAGIVVLFYMYGNIRYKEGRRNGYVSGSLKSTAQLLTFLESAKVIGVTQSGDIYRIDDLGNRSAIVFDSVDALRKLDNDLQTLLDTTQKDLDTR